MPRRYFGSGFFAPPSIDPTAYLALVAFFGGDEAAATAYLAQLEAYAADGGEAQDLLDAAEAAGDVATAIAILEGGGVQTFAERIAELVDADCAVLIVPTPAASPYLVDLAGVIGSGDWTAALTMLSGAALDGYGGRSSSGAATLPGASGPVQIPGECTVHVLFNDFSTSGAAGYLASVSGAGETEASNYLWGLAAQASTYDYFAEVGAGSNQIAQWGRSLSAAKSRRVLLSLTRSATGRLRLYENGVLLTATSVSGAGGSLGPAGAYVDLPLPSGGSSSQLWWASDPTELLPVGDVAMIAIYTAEQDAAAVLAVAQAVE